MEKLLRLLLASGQIAIVLVVSVSGVFAADKFTNRDVRGPYGFSFDGTIGVPPAGRVAAVGHFVAGGDGNITDGVRTLVVTGAPLLQQTFTCAYAVNPDGTGHATCEVSGAPPTEENFEFVITSAGVHFITTDPGVIARGVAVGQ